MENTWHRLRQVVPLQSHSVRCMSLTQAVIACITGSIAEAFYGIPADIRERAETYLPEQMLATVHEFETRFGAR